MIEPVRKTITVPLPPEAAFDLFTAGMWTWWPGETHSLSAMDKKSRPKHVEIEPRLGGRILETMENGDKHPWATITRWDPGAGFTLNWYVGRDEAEATMVDVTFAADGDGTKLTLVHSGFEILGEGGQKSRDNYNSGWGPVLNDSFSKACVRESV